MLDLPLLLKSPRFSRWNDILTGRLARGIGANAFSQVVVAASQLSLVPVMATSWGVDRYGVWLLLFTIPAYLGLGEFGIGTAAGTRMTMEVARGDRDGAVTTFQSAVAALGVAVLLLTAAGLTTIATVPLSYFATATVSEHEVRWVLIALLLYGVLSILTSLPNAAFRCCGRYAQGATLNALTLLAEATAAVSSVYAGADLVGVAVAYLLVRAAALTVQYRVLRSAVPWLSIGFQRASMDRVREVTAPALALMALPFAQAVSLQGGAQVVGIAVSAAAVATFTSVRTLIRTGVQMTTLVNHAVMPELSAAASRGEAAVVRRIVALTVASSLMVVVPAAAVLLVFGPDIIAAWTRGTIHPDWDLVAVMTAVMVVNGIWHPLSNLLLAINRQASYSYVFAAASVVAILASIPLCSQLGVSGAAWALLALDVFMLQHVTRRIRSILLVK